MRRFAPGGTVSGITIVAVGLFLLVVGLNSWDNLAVQLAGVLSHAPSRTSVVLILSGMLLSASGVLILLRRRPRLAVAAHD